MSKHRTAPWLRVAYGIAALGAGVLAWRGTGAAPGGLDEGTDGGASWSAVVARADELTAATNELSRALSKPAPGRIGRAESRALAQRMRVASIGVRELLEIPAVRERLPAVETLERKVARIEADASDLGRGASALGPDSGFGLHLGELAGVLADVQAAAGEADAAGEPAPEPAPDNAGESPPDAPAAGSDGDEEVRSRVLLAALAFVFANFGLVAVQCLRARAVPRFVQEVFTGSASFLIGAAMSTW